jgi:hypothetical protein
MINVRLLKDWNWKKKGDVVSVFEPTGENWILNEIAERVTESRSIEVESASAEPPEGIERATVSEKRRMAKRP